MASLDCEVAARDIMRKVELTITVSGLGVLRARIWAGMQLMKLAAAVIGCQIKIDEARNNESYDVERCSRRS